MSERAKRVGATLRFESDEEGTRVELRLPKLTAEPTEIETA
jgi:signal transduction histidine kinase